jgi:glycosyltransferase involved in cell wall biosynthesis
MVAGLAAPAGSKAIPRVSIVIATRNRADAIPTTLRCYERLIGEVPWELIVVDNGSTDATRETLDRFQAGTAIDLRVLSEPGPGASRARNTGWRAARAEVIVFTDDDCYPEPDYVVKVAETFDAGNADYLGGRILLHDPEDAPVTIQTRETPDTIAPGSFVRAGLIQGCNMAVTRQALERIGGFDEMLGAGTPFHCEEIDLVSRASAAGFAGAYDPRPVVRHHHRRRTQEQVRALIKGYDIGRGAYYAKCMLDPRRRGPAWKGWVELLKVNLREARTSVRAAIRIGYELYGALAYLIHLAGRKLSGRR